MSADVIAGRFALCDPIGSGGSGTVWRAFDGKRGGFCAAKLLRQRDAGDLLRFVREQSVRLDHPHIVSPYSWVAEDGTVLIASELMMGGSVHTLIGDYGPLAESTVAVVLGQVLSGLQAVHDAELIHRDVKPANLLLHATGTGPLRVVLTDFGLTISRLDARFTQVGMVIGTPGYVPPEVLAGGVPPDPRHDLYAAGRLALTMIAGEEPGGRTTDVIGSIREPALRTAVQALLRPDPEDRPVDANAAIALLANVPTESGPRTRDGDRIEVLNQLPPLPAGWGPDGPVGPAIPGPTRPAPRATIVDVATTAPAMIDPLPTVTNESVPPRSVLPRSVSGTTPKPGRPLLIAVAAAVLLVGGLVMALWLWPDTSTNDPADPPVTTGTTPMSTGSPSVASPTPGTPTTPAASPTATATVTDAALRAGDGCSWQEEGDRRTGVDGAALVCTLTDGAYQWRPPG